MSFYTKHKTRIKTHETTVLCDMLTPIQAFYKLRDVAPNPVLLESTNFQSKEQSRSFLCLEPIAGFQLRGLTAETYFLDKSRQVELDKTDSAITCLDDFLEELKTAVSSTSDSSYNGVFGYTAFEAVNGFEPYLGHSTHSEEPSILYQFYRFVIVFDHFKNTMTIIENQPGTQTSKMSEILALLRAPGQHTLPFSCSDERHSNMSDTFFLELIEKAKQHCRRGDVFQMVCSRAFQRSCSGDPFTLYRALRMVNPSPYLFFFDYGAFKLFGSSPEAHIVIRDGRALLNPIAGTYRRANDQSADKDLVTQLQADPKEHSEHVMLVDLARNDINRITDGATLTAFKESQLFSHVIHLTSTVEGRLKSDHTPFAALAATFPAGTLSGAPKIKAVSLIQEFEPTARGYYGGAIGYIGFSGEVNHAIMIRSFKHAQGTLSYQAGAGVVIDSVPQKELQEVENKVAALEKAISICPNINL